MISSPFATRDFSPAVDLRPHLELEWTCALFFFVSAERFRIESGRSTDRNENENKNNEKTTEGARMRGNGAWVWVWSALTAL